MAIIGANQGASSAGSVGGAQQAGPKATVQSTKDREANGEALANKAHKGSHSQPNQDDVHKKMVAMYADSAAAPSS